MLTTDIPCSRTRRRQTAEPMKPAPPVTSTRIGYSPRLFENGGEIGEHRQPAILVGQNRLCRSNRPLNSQFGIGPVDSAVMRGRIDLIDLVKDDRIWLERAKAVGKACWNEELFVTLTAQLRGNMPPKAG